MMYHLKLQAAEALAAEDRTKMKLIRHGNCLVTPRKTRRRRMVAASK
jgi:hypothetical protein